MDVSIREVTEPTDAAIAAFGLLQRAVYFEPDALIPGEALGWLLSRTSGERSNFMLVAERGTHVVGGTVFHYLASAGSGFSSFMGVDGAARGQGIARRLHEARFDVLRRAS